MIGSNMIFQCVGLVTLFLWGCLSACSFHDVRVGEIKYACRSTIDCPDLGEKCLPVSTGNSLSDYCAQFSCPNIQGFELFTELHLMPKVCDFDQNSDGIADVAKSYSNRSRNYA